MPDKMYCPPIVIKLDGAATLEIVSTESGEVVAFYKCLGHGQWSKPLLQYDSQHIAQEQIDKIKVWMESQILKGN